MRSRHGFLFHRHTMQLILFTAVVQTVGSIPVSVRWLTVTGYKTTLKTRTSKWNVPVIQMWAPQLLLDSCTNLYRDRIIFPQHSGNEWMGFILLDGIHTFDLDSLTYGSSITWCRSAGGRKQGRNFNPVLLICLYRETQQTSSVY